MSCANAALALGLIVACAGPEPAPSARSDAATGARPGAATATRSSQGAGAAAPLRFDQPGVLAALMATAQQEGSVRIMVEFPGPRQAPAAPELWSTQVDPTLTANQDGVLQLMGIEVNDPSITRYRTIPNLAVTVSAAELGLLAQAMAAPDFPYRLRVGPDDVLVRHGPATSGLAPLRESVVNTGASEAIRGGHYGSGYHVAVIDDGIDYHEFTGEKVVNGGRFTAGDFTAEYGDPGLGVAGLTEGLSHGTKAAAIICGNESGTLPPTDVSGMAPDARLVAIRIFGPGDKAYVSDLLLALEELFLDYLTRYLEGASELAAVNVSLGFDQYASPEACYEATTYGKSAEYLGTLLLLIDAPVVCSAGNDYSEDSIAFPAVLATTVAVGAVDDAMNPLGPSNWSADLTNAAPGYQIYGHQDPATGVMEFLGSGTSAAAPHVSGALALMRGAYPEADGVELMAALKETDTMTISLGKKPSVPMLNVINAMKLLEVMP